MSTVVETVESRALAGNPLGDATARRIAVWLPPSYATAPERRLYLAVSDTTYTN